MAEQVPEAAAVAVPVAAPIEAADARAATIRKIVNFVLFYAGWFGCAFGLAWGWAWLGPLSGALVVAVRLALSTERRRDAEALLAVTLLGPALDTILIATGAVGVTTEARLFGLYAPPSLIALWAIFGTTFHSSLGWMCTRPVVSVPFAAIGAPLTYIAAERLGSLQILTPALADGRIYIIVVWVLGLPAILWLSTRIHTRSLEITA